MKFNKKRTTVQKEKNKDKIHYKILIGLLIIGVLYYLFFEPNIIGNDSRYTYYIILTPITIGILLLLIYRKDFLIYNYIYKIILNLRKEYSGQYFVHGGIPRGTACPQG